MRFDPKASFGKIMMLFPFETSPGKTFFSGLGLNYGVFGPWPKPSPVSPETLPPTALHLPREEIDEFRSTIVARYKRTLRWSWKNALIYSIRNKGLKDVTDEEFTNFICDTSFSRFLNPQLDEKDRILFSAFLTEKEGCDKKYYKVDFSATSLIKPLPGVHCSPSVTLFQRSDRGEFVPLVIAINGLLIEPQDRNAWELSKYFVLQSAATHLICCDHPRLHFPMNAINGISKSILPQDHILFKLLKPHLWLQLPLDFAVLYHEKSVGHNNQKEIYTPFSGDISSFFALLEAGYHGLDGNSSYPKYTYSLSRPQIHSNYGEFLGRYYKCIYQFVEKVVSELPVQDKTVSLWAKYVSAHVPGFPGENEIHQGNHLALAVSTFIFSVSVFHSADHYSYSAGSINQVPLRLRCPPPVSRTIDPVSKIHALGMGDVFRQYMANEMFFKDSPLSKLVEVDYEFESISLKQAQEAFIRHLFDVEKNLGLRKYIPLTEIACSIQY